MLHKDLIRLYQKIMFHEFILDLQMKKRLQRRLVRYFDPDCMTNDSILCNQRVASFELKKIMLMMRI